MVILWFRQDLRLSDNPALTNAINNNNILPIYIDDTANSNVNGQQKCTRIGH